MKTIKNEFKVCSLTYNHLKRKTSSSFKLLWEGLSWKRQTYICKI